MGIIEVVIVVSLICGRLGQDILSECNFDKRSLCDLSQGRDDSGGDWKFREKNTPSGGNTGPIHDRTFVASGKRINGLYIFTEATKKTGKTYHLELPVYSLYKNWKDEPTCLRFYYNMWGEDQGEFSIRPGYGQTPIWTKKGDQHTGSKRNKEIEWLPAQVSVYKNIPMVIIEVTIGNNWRSDVALDDLTLLKGCCSGPDADKCKEYHEPTTTTSTSTTTTTTTTTTTSPEIQFPNIVMIPARPNGKFSYPSSVLEGALVMLRGDTTSFGKEGVVYLLMEGQLGTICDDDWTEANSNAVCRHIGYPAGRRIEVREEWLAAQDGVRVWLDGVRCPTNARSLMDCCHNEVGLHDCSYQESVALSCQGTFGELPPVETDKTPDGPCDQIPNCEVVPMTNQRPIPTTPPLPPSDKDDNDDDEDDDDDGSDMDGDGDDEDDDEDEIDDDNRDGDDDEECDATRQYYIYDGKCRQMRMVLSSSFDDGARNVMKYDGFELRTEAEEHLENHEKDGKPRHYFVLDGSSTGDFLSGQIYLEELYLNEPRQYCLTFKYNVTALTVLRVSLSKDITIGPVELYDMREKTSAPMVRTSITLHGGSPGTDVPVGPYSLVFMMQTINNNAAYLDDVEIVNFPCENPAVHWA